MEKIVLVIPCYNEETRLPVAEFESFLSQHDDVIICFVNDGSKDKTDEVTQSICNRYKDKACLVSYPGNVGKAEAVRRGIQFCLKELKFDYIGYFDADLSTSLEECYLLKSYLVNKKEFCFGSRIMIVGADIERSTQRHYTGRLIATFISNILKINVYDTQCGCKLFTRDVAEYIFKEPFISKWLFDVELFARMIKKYGKEAALTKMREVPLDKWINKDGSKVKMSYFFKLWIDLYRIKRSYI